MANSQRPRDAKASNSKDFVVWSSLLALLLIVAAGVLYSVKKEDSHIHIPEDAFEDVKPSAPERVARDSAPNAVLMPRHMASEESDEAPQPVAEGERSPALQRAMELVDSGQWNEAEPILLSELQRDPKNLAALMELSMIQIIDKNLPSAATPYLEEILRIDPNNNSAMLELINVYSDTESFAAGSQFLKSIPMNDENRGMIQAGLGNLNAGAGNNQEAVSLLKSAIYESQNTSFQARKDLAEAYESLGRADEANQEYMNIINGSYKPQQQRRAKIDLAKNYAAQKRYSEAYSLLEDIIAQNPKDKSAARTLSEIQAQAAR